MAAANVIRFGRRLWRYREFLQVQHELHALRKESKIPDTVLTLQYEPVYTVGKRGKEDHFLRSPEVSDLKNSPSDRGGEVTYHGPGQIVLYPIVHLREKRLGARLFVEKLENVMIQLASEYGLSAQGQIKNKTGVWIAEKKIGAIGVRISSGISSHGIAFNVKPDLGHYDNIIPCGLDNKNVTSLDQETDVSSVAEVDGQLVNCFLKEFKYTSVQQRSLTDVFKSKHTKQCHQTSSNKL